MSKEQQHVADFDRYVQFHLAQVAWRADMSVEDCRAQYMDALSESNEQGGPLTQQAVQDQMHSELATAFIKKVLGHIAKTFGLSILDIAASKSNAKIQSKIRQELALGGLLGNGQSVDEYRTLMWPVMYLRYVRKGLFLQSRCPDNDEYKTAQLLHALDLIQAYLQVKLPVTYQKSLASTKILRGN